MSNPPPSAPPLEENPYYVPTKSYQTQEQIPVVSAVPVTASAVPISVDAYTAPPNQSIGPIPVTGVAPNTGSTTTTVTTNVYKIQDLGRQSVELTCPFCGHCERTKVSTEFSTGSLIWTVVMCFVFCPAVFCVCCCRELQDTIHRCKNCRRVVGRTPSFAECC